MSNVTDLPKTKAQEAIAAAKAELADEQLVKGVSLLKVLLKQEAETETVLANIAREIVDLEERIEQGNI